MRVRQIRLQQGAAVPKIKGIQTATKKRNHIDRKGILATNVSSFSTRRARSSSGVTEICIRPV